MGKKSKESQIKRSQRLKTQRHFSWVKTSLLKPTWVVLLVGLFLIQLIFSNYLATKGQELKELEMKQAELHKKKVALEEEIVKTSSLSRIQKESQEKLQMVSGAGSVQYLSPEKVAILQ